MTSNSGHLGFQQFLLENRTADLQTTATVMNYADWFLPGLALLPNSSWLQRTSQDEPPGNVSEILTGMMAENKNGSNSQRTQRKTPRLPRQILHRCQQPLIGAKWDIATEIWFNYWGTSDSELTNYTLLFEICKSPSSAILKKDLNHILISKTKYWY